MQLPCCVTWYRGSASKQGTCRTSAESPGIMRKYPQTTIVIIVLLTVYEHIFFEKGLKSFESKEHF